MSNIDCATATRNTVNTVNTVNYRDCFNKRLLSILFLGFSSGLPLSLVGTTLQSWYAVSGVDIVTIGLVSLVGQPYAFKYIWSPVMDHFTLPFLGRRRGWMLLCQLCLIALFVLMSALPPTHYAGVLAWVALIAAFVSASQDIVIDAYRTDILDHSEQGLGAAMAIMGYRVAMLASGSLALIIADYYGWHITYLIMAACMLLGVITTLISDEPAIQTTSHAHTTTGKHDEIKSIRFHQAIIAPFKQFLSREKAILLLVFIVLYRFSESFSTTVGPLTSAFLLDGLHLSLTTVGAINTGVGLIASLIGAFVAGLLLLRINLYFALMGFGVFQAFANLGFVALAVVGPYYPLLVAAVCLDNFSYGLGSTALVALIMRLCDKRYSATQFALLSSIAAISRVFIGPIGGWIVKHTDWSHFFICSVIILMPALALLYYLRDHINNAALKSE